MSWKRMISSHLRFLDCDKVKRGICFNLIPEWVFCSPTSFSYRASYFKQGRKLIIPFHVPQDQPTFFGWVFFQPKTQFSNQRTWVLCDWRNSHVLVSHDPFYQKTLLLQNGSLIWIYFDPPDENWVIRRWVWGFTQINRSKSGGTKEPCFGMQ